MIIDNSFDFVGAAAAADCARKLDLADRYLNCIAVKAAFRAGQIDEAEKMAALFTKDENQISNLVEMQCMWYEIACGNAHLRNKDYGKVHQLANGPLEVMLKCKRSACLLFESYCGLIITYSSTSWVLSL